ncbi:MAG: class I SAM-dependent methyltransferase [Candidatus Marinimicrobia bacterium]|nr:class I SAM-dependent methyltransferase [Candidatus Neomarinimicrobiota bacterium]
MKNIVVQNCPACGSNNYIKVLTTTDYLVSRESFEIMECNDCSLRFTSPIPNNNEIGNYYKSDDYISHTGRGNSIINKIYRIVRYFTLHSKKKKVIKFSQNQSGSILDIGCGTGNFLKIMKQSGWKINGVEINDTARGIAKNNTGSVILNQIEFFESKQKYDVITLWHSLEHLHDLKRYLNKISISLNANGMVMIAVPNYQSFDADYFKQYWAAYEVPRHLYHFSFDAIVKLLEKFKFKLLQSVQLPFDSSYISLLSEMSVRKKQNIVKAFLVGLKSYFAGRRDTKRGSSILYVFKKNQ